MPHSFDIIGEFRSIATRNGFFVPQLPALQDCRYVAGGDAKLRTKKPLAKHVICLTLPLRFFKRLPGVRLFVMIDNMKRLSMKIRMVIIGVIVLLCVTVPIGSRMLISGMRYCRQVAAWGALDTSIMLELDDYYVEHGRYPDSLAELDLLFSDGAGPEMLDQIQFQSEMSSCRYHYYRHAGQWDLRIKTRVDVSFTDGALRHKTMTNETIIDD